MWRWRGRDDVGGTLTGPTPHPSSVCVVAMGERPGAGSMHDGWTCVSDTSGMQAGWVPATANDRGLGAWHQPLPAAKIGMCSSQTPSWGLGIVVYGIGDCGFLVLPPSNLTPLWLPLAADVWPVTVIYWKLTAWHVRWSTGGALRLGAEAGLHLPLHPSSLEGTRNKKKSSRGRRRLECLDV